MISARKWLASPSLLAPIPLPRPRETHFWYIVPDEVQQPSLLNQYMDLLSTSERDDVSCMKDDKLRKRALLARVLVRSTLARYTNQQLHPRSLNFRKNNYGKPEIGIDVEEKQRKLRNNILSFARRYFSRHEVDYLQAFSDPEIQRQEFIKLWTLKEAYVKALGRGFSAAPFSAFTIRFRGGEGMHNPGELRSDASQIILEASDDPKNLTDNWKFALFELASSHYAAICIEKDDCIKGNGSGSLRLKAWKTLPFVEDECVSGTDAIVSISGLL
ncbi:uncharacterized protein LOC131256737 isoform X2 [Magnolia sinica]|uniref:uncharacterized protein LOC131256737 isoform X2 n=1 Tax=Magnolia sinica TaxID=86752 RepID=UPI0026589666|nr:uncharacterized protein LOC131256737 isoform X2 [Magnolia sinica]